jgi:hypothetical protein
MREFEFFFISLNDNNKNVPLLMPYGGNGPGPLGLVGSPLEMELYAKI